MTVYNRITHYFYLHLDAYQPIAYSFTDTLKYYLTYYF